MSNDWAKDAAYLDSLFRARVKSWGVYRHRELNHRRKKSEPHQIAYERELAEVLIAEAFIGAPYASRETVQQKLRYLRDNPPQPSRAQVSDQERFARFYEMEIDTTLTRTEE